MALMAIVHPKRAHFTMEWSRKVLAVGVMGIGREDPQSLTVPTSLGREAWGTPMGLSGHEK